MAKLSRVYIDNYNYLTLYAEETGTSTSGNYSSVHAWLDLHVASFVSSSGISVGVTGGSSDLGYRYWSAGDYRLVDGYYNAPHNNDGSGSTYVSGYFNSNIGNWNLGGTLGLTKINRQATVTSATDFNDEGNPTINFSNPAGYRINARLEFSGTSIRRDNIPNTGSYTFNLTAEERTLLRSKTPNSNKLTVREVIATCLSSTTESLWSWQDKTMTIVNANPVFSNFEFEDVNPITLALTGDSSVNVNGYSNIKATISTLNKAEAIKQATMTKYQFRVGTSNPLDISYSSDSEVSGIINNAPNGSYNVYAIDSRQNSTLVTKLASSEIEYQPIFIDKQNSSIKRNDNQVGENAVLTLNGTIWNDSFGDVTNSITSVTYKFKKTSDSQWITGTTTITPTVSQNSFTFTGQIASDNQDTSWDLDSSYNIQVIISDELSSSTIDLILNSAIPTLSLDKEGVGVMCAYDSSLGGGLQVYGRVLPTWDLLWENSNPTSEMNANTDIILSSDDYDMLIWIFDFNVGVSPHYYNSAICLKGQNVRLCGVIANATDNTATRNLTYDTDTKYIALDGMLKATAQARRCVPIKCYGIKL